MNPKVDEYLAQGCMRCEFGGTPKCKVHNWTEELENLRSIVLDSGLLEEVKWGVPCYTLDKKNVLIVSAFKDYCSISFFKGVLLKDPEKILEKQGPNSQSDRSIRFTAIDQIRKQESIIRAYIKEAIEVEKKGLKVDFNAKHELVYPKELISKFEELPALQKSFEALTPGRKRGYILHFTQPKQSATRISRIVKCIPKIMDGKGFHDR